jgi:sugar lactone lactonase YvrE
LFITLVDTAVLRWHSAGIMVAGIGGTAGLASNQLNAPIDMALDSSNTLYISDCFNNRVQKWVADAPNATTVAGQANGVGGATAAYLRGPIGVLVDSNNNIYVSDSTNHRIQFWANGVSSGTTIAGTGRKEI